MGQGLRYPLDLGDPPVGSSQESRILAEYPKTPEKGAVEPYRAVDESVIDTVLLVSTDESINDLRPVVSELDHADFCEALQCFIQALRNFRRAYTFWLCPHADDGMISCGALLLGKIPDFPLPALSLGKLDT